MHMTSMYSPPPTHTHTHTPTHTQPKKSCCKLCSICIVSAGSILKKLHNYAHSSLQNSLLGIHIFIFILLFLDDPQQVFHSIQQVIKGRYEAAEDKHETDEFLKPIIIDPEGRVRGMIEDVCGTVIQCQSMM